MGWDRLDRLESAKCRGKKWHRGSILYFLSTCTDTLIKVYCSLKQETLGLHTLDLWRNHLHVSVHLNGFASRQLLSCIKVDKLEAIIS